MPKKKSPSKSSYVMQRDQFYQKHRYAQYLLGTLAIAFAIWLGVQVRNIRATQYIMLQLVEEGIDPNSIDLQP